MNRLKRLIVEIHHRSLWQVLLIYCGAALVAYQAVQALTEGLDLPQWFPALAIVLFIIGLPIVLATAFVREVEVASPAPAEAEPRIVEAEAAAARYEARRHRRFLTWRNTLATFVVALAVWGIVATGWLVLHDGAGETDGERKSVAVLPFVNLSGDPNNEYFSDGVTGDIINHLSKIADLKVISRTSAMQYKGTTRSLREIGDELGVATVLEGEVQRMGDRVRINAQLIDAETDVHLWSEQYNRQLTDVFAIQSDVAQHIALALRTTLTAAERGRIEERPTESLEAYDNYLRGRHFWTQRSVAAFDSAIRYFNRAVLLDPDYARAYAGLAETYALVPEYGGPSVLEILPYARVAIERALTLDPDLAEAYVASAYIKDKFEWDRNAAERDYLKAIELDPDYATAHQWYSELLGTCRRWDEGLEEGHKAVELDPASPAANQAYGSLLVYSGRLDDGIAFLERALVLLPDFVPATWQLAGVYVMKGDYASAAPLFDRLAELTGGDPAAYRAYLAALTDPAMIPDAAAALQAPTVYGNAGGAEYLAHLGRYDEALTVLERHYEERDPFLPYVNMVPLFDGLRSDPRFQDLLRRMNFPE